MQKRNVQRERVFTEIEQHLIAEAKFYEPEFTVEIQNVYSNINKK